MSKENNIEKNKENKIVILNILSTLILQGLAFLTTPIFTRMLGKEQFGDYSVCFSWITIAACVMGFCINSSIATGRLDFKERYNEFRSSVFLFGLSSSLIIFLLAFCGRNIIASLIEYPNKIVIVILIGACSQYVIDFYNSICIYEKKAVQNLILSILLAVSTVLLSMILIMQNSNKSELYFSRLVGSVVPYTVIAIVFTIVFLFNNKICIKKEYCQYGLKLGLPIVFHLLAGNVLSQSDRVMMKMYGVPSGDIGIYSLYYLLANVLFVVLMSLNNAWCPFYLDDIKENRLGEIKYKTRNYIELFTVIAVGFIFLSREVGLIMGGEDYKSGVNILPILAFYVFFNFMYLFPVNYEFYSKKTYLITMATILAGIVNIILNGIMIPLWGYWGATIATTLSYACLFIIHYTFVKKFINKDFHSKIAEFIPGIMVLVVATILFYVLADMWLVRWIAAICIGAIELYRIWKRKRIF